MQAEAERTTCAEAQPSCANEGVGAVEHPPKECTQQQPVPLTDATVQKPPASDIPIQNLPLQLETQVLAHRRLLQQLNTQPHNTQQHPQPHRTQTEQRARARPSSAAAASPLLALPEFVDNIGCVCVCVTV